MKSLQMKSFGTRAAYLWGAWQVASMAYTPSKDDSGKGSFMKSPYWPKTGNKKNKRGGNEQNER